jgi:hypothetical protein
MYFLMRCYRQMSVGNPVTAQRKCEVPIRANSHLPIRTHVTVHYLCWELFSTPILTLPRSLVSFYLVVRWNPSCRGIFYSWTTMIKFEKLPIQIYEQWSVQQARGKGSNTSNLLSSPRR